jgi:hypothetical protein
VPITTLSNYKAWSGLRGTGYDASLTAIIGQAEAKVRRHAGRSLTDGYELASRVEFYDGAGVEVIQLREYPVTTITSVETRDQSGSYTTRAATDYRVNLDTGQLYLLGSGWGRNTFDYTGGGANLAFGVQPNWGGDPQNVRVTYTAGYTTIPADIVLAVFLLTDYLFANAGGDMTATSESIGIYSKGRGGTYISPDHILKSIMPERGVLI